MNRCARCWRLSQREDHHYSSSGIAKVLKGFGGAGVLEVVEDGAGGTYRAVYTVKFDEARAKELKNAKSNH